MVRLTDRPGMALDVYRGRKTTMQTNISRDLVNREKYLYSLTHCILVDSSTVICWTSPFVIFYFVALFYSG